MRERDIRAGMFAAIVVAGCALLGCSSSRAGGSSSSTPETSPNAGAPASASPTPAASVAVCAKGASIDVTNPLPFGRVLHEGDSLAVTVKYSGPGCKVIQANFFGYHAGGSAWYQHVCAPECTGQVTTVFLNAGVPLNTPAGTIELVPEVGHYPAQGSSDPGIEGFTLCQVRIVMNDGVFAGPSFERTFGDAC